MDLLNQLWQASGIYQMTAGQFVMILVGLLLLYLAIAKKFEPLLLVTIGFGGILSNIPGVEIATGDCIADSLEWSGERWQMRRDNNGRASNEC